MTKWKRRLKRECTLILTAAVMCGCLNVPGTPAFAEKDSTAVEEPSDAETAVSFTVPFPGDDLADPDTLFAGYIEKVFCGEQNTGSPALGAMGERRLQGYDKELYDALKEKIGQIASGTLEGTRVAVVLSEPLKWKIEDPESKIVEDEFNGTIDIENILTCLRADSPYELYWLDKTAEVYVGYSYSFDGQYYTVSRVDFSFAVSAGYQADGNPYKVDRQQAAEAELAAENARAIVEQYKDRSDYEKLKAYLQEICGLVSYDIAAETDEKENGVVETAGEAPWQMIRVFDGKADTNAACEGYTMAFRYLCDMSEFADTTCCTVTGTMAGGRGEGPHMWNIVTTGGKSYLVDAANCDTGALGAPDLLFMAGASGYVDGSYTAVCNGIPITYTYDSSQRRLYGSGILTLSQEAYLSETVLTVTVDKVSVVYGDAVSADLLKGSALSGGEAVPGTFSWEPGVISYGGAGTKTLKAVFTPDDLSAHSRTEVDVPVTVDPADYQVTEAAEQNVLAGSGDFTEPAFTGVNGETVAGTLTYTYGKQSGTYADLKRYLSESAENQKVTVSYSFTASDPNYVSAEKTGRLTFTVTTKKAEEDGIKMSFRTILALTY